MLSKSELKNIPEYGNLGPRDKKNLNYRIKDKIGNIKNVLAEINLLLTLPDDFIKEHIDRDALIEGLKVTERILQILDPWAIGEHEDGGKMAFRVWGSVIPASKPGECTIDSASYTATKEEIDLHEQLKCHINKVRFYVDPCIPDPICRDPEYSRNLMNRFMQITAINFSSYFDIVGVTEDRWQKIAPVQIDKDQLKWMRWKPRGLKECMKIEQPPLLKEKRLPVQSTTEVSITASSTPEEIERFEEAIQEGPKLTEKELLEINERIKRIPRSDEESQPK